MRLFLLFQKVYRGVLFLSEVMNHPWFPFLFLPSSRGLPKALPCEFRYAMTKPAAKHPGPRPDDFSSLCALFRSRRGSFTDSFPRGFSALSPRFLIECLLFSSRREDPLSLALCRGLALSPPGPDGRRSRSRSLYPKAVPFFSWSLLFKTYVPFRKPPPAFFLVAPWRSSKPPPLS